MDFFVSDLHICNGKSGVDDFRPHVGAFIKFVREVVKLPENALYVVGDFLELDQAHLEEILCNYQTLWEMLRYIKVIPGNHDEVLSAIDFALAWEILPTEYIKEYNGKRFYITHGHQWDKFNKPGTSIGHIVTGLWTYAEQVGAAEQPIQKIINTLLPLGTQEAVKAAKVKNCEYVIMGHDHRPRVKKMNGIAVYNCGTLTHMWPKQGYPYVCVDEAGNPSLEWFMP